MHYILALLQYQKQIQRLSMAIVFQNSSTATSFSSSFPPRIRIWQSLDCSTEQRKKHQALENLISRFQSGSSLSSILEQEKKRPLPPQKPSFSTFKTSEKAHEDNRVGIMVINFSLNYNGLKKDNKVSASSPPFPTSTPQTVFSPPSSHLENYKITFASFMTLARFDCSAATLLQMLSPSSQGRSGPRLVRLSNLDSENLKSLTSLVPSAFIFFTKYHDGVLLLLSGYPANNLLRTIEHRLLAAQVAAPSKSSFSFKLMSTPKKRTLKILLPARSISLQKQCSEIDNARKQYYFQNNFSSFNKICLTQSQGFMLDGASQERELLLLKKVNRELRKSFLFGMKPFWRKQLLEFLSKVGKYWQVYRNTFKKDLTLFVRLNEYKMIHLCCHFQGTLKNSPENSLYQKIYPEINTIIKNLLKILDLQSLQTIKDNFLNEHKGTLEKRKEQEGTFMEGAREWYRVEKDSQQQAQLINAVTQYHLFLSKKTVLNPYFIKDLEEGLRSSLSCQTLPTLSLPSLKSPLPTQQLFNIIMFEVSRSLAKTAAISKRQSLLKEKKREFLSEIQCERLTDSSCLGCCKFFYSDSNIYDEELCKTPFKIFSSINQVSKFESELKDTICAMINCGGGVIMFDCKLSEKDLTPQGSFLTEQNKESEQRRIGSYLQSFYPPLEINKNVEISFVPILVSPFSEEKSGAQRSYMGEQGNFKQHEYYNHRQFIRGYYVTRLRVKPSNGYQVFYWFKTKKSQNDLKEEDIYCCVFDGDKIKYLKIGEMIKLIQRRFRKYFVPDSCCSQKERILMAKPFDVFGHQCCKPDSGIQVAQSVAKEVKEVKVEEAKEKPSNDRGLHTKHEGLYSNTALLVVDSAHLDAIKDKLDRQGVKCKIEKRFDSYKLRPSLNSAILHYDHNFEQVYQKLVNDSRFNFSNGKSMLMIEVKTHLKFENILNKNFPGQSDAKRYQKWLRQEFPSENLKLCSYVVGKYTEIYLITESKLPALFMYFVLNHHKEKVVFRNALSFDKFGPDETRFRVLFDTGLKA